MKIFLNIILIAGLIAISSAYHNEKCVTIPPEGELTSEPTPEPTPEPTRIAEPCLREVELCNEKDFKICTELYRFSKAGCAELTQDKHLSARTKGPYMCEVHSGTDCLGESAFVTQSGANYPFEIQSVSLVSDSYFHEK
ncbi:CLUMA_CG012352, isoform A [Clunio marinus]|uniref:CLUMA_CG012352, isoform A n=1 Tax=Clunio marinus TaxID=568069 RepID=A0A1J1IEY5_9DIPT|nr:CLUMA_CG012352, isoform A [Clunio marinus]